MLNARTLEFLKTRDVPFEIFPHRTTFTAQGLAEASHVSGWHVAKVVVVRSEPGGDVLMAVLPASCRLDLTGLARASGHKRLELLSEAEIERLFPDCELGAETPFGNLYGLPVFMDVSLREAREIVFQAGNHHEAARMSVADFERLVKPQIADFCRY